jgi:hypothetical protein
MSDTAPTTATPETTPSGREKNGRFAKGNPGGPGNPYARRMAAIRKQMIEFMTPERTHLYLMALLEHTLKGNMAAAKLLAEHTAGKPLAGVDGDRLAMDEWIKRLETVVMMQQVGELMRTPDPELPLGMVRQAQPVVTDEIAEQLGAVLADPSQLDEPMPDLEFVDDDEDLPDDEADDAPPSPNGDNGDPAAVAVPSPNGDNGRAAAGRVAAGGRASAAAPSTNGDNGGSPGQQQGDRRRRTGQ